MSEQTKSTDGADEVSPSLIEILKNNDPRQILEEFKTWVDEKGDWDAPALVSRMALTMTRDDKDGVNDDLLPIYTLLMQRENQAAIGLAMLKLLEAWRELRWYVLEELIDRDAHGQAQSLRVVQTES